MQRVGWSHQCSAMNCWAFSWTTGNTPRNIAGQWTDWKRTANPWSNLSISCSGNRPTAQWMSAKNHSAGWSVTSWTTDAPSILTSLLPERGRSVLRVGILKACLLEVATDPGWICIPRRSNLRPHVACVFSREIHSSDPQCEHWEDAVLLHIPREQPGSYSKEPSALMPRGHRLRGGPPSPGHRPRSSSWQRLLASLFPDRPECAPN